MKKARVTVHWVTRWERNFIFGAVSLFWRVNCNVDIKLLTNQMRVLTMSIRGYKDSLCSYSWGLRTVMIFELHYSVHYPSMFFFFGQILHQIPPSWHKQQRRRTCGYTRWSGPDMSKLSSEARVTLSKQVIRSGPLENWWGGGWARGNMILCLLIIARIKRVREKWKRVSTWV